MLYNSGHRTTTHQPMLPNTIRNQAIDIAEACDYELTFQELIRFLPASVVAEFNEHMTEVADLDDIMHAAD
jgi:hypothetical protein